MDTSTTPKPEFDKHLRDATLDAFAERIELLLSEPKIEDRQVREAFTCLEMLFALVVNTGNGTLRLSRIRTWRTAAMARVGAILGIPQAWEPLLVDVFNRLEFAVEPSSIYRLVYLSRAVRPMEQADLNDILQASHRNNRRVNVTGLLLYGNVRGQPSFLQVLEGRKEEVEALYEKIKADSRHTQCEVCFTEEGAERHFPGWSMGYRKLDQATADQFAEGYTAFLNEPGADFAKAGPVSEKLRDMILAFKNLP